MGGKAIVIGAGQIGWAVSGRLSGESWFVDVLSRRGGTAPDGVRHVAADRHDDASLIAAIDGGADLLVDTIAYDEADATQLLMLQDRVGQIVALSTISVYCDDEGRTLDEAAVNGFPELPEAMTETQRTVAPGRSTYSTRKAAMEQVLLDGATIPATVLRAGAVYGIGSSAPREWWAVKRMLDGRKRIPVALDGASRFHTVATDNLAALVSAVAAGRVPGIFNAVDPQVTGASAILQCVADTMEADVEFVRFPGLSGHVGQHPWAVPRPFTASDAAARAIGYQPAGGYADLAPSVIEWLAGQDSSDWQQRFPGLAAYPYDLFDYAAEDAFLKANAAP